MSNSLLALSFDTADAAAIAGFWAEVLDRPIADGATTQFAAIGVVDATLTGPRLMFHQVPEGKRVKNRLHLDIVASGRHDWTDVTTAAADAVERGGSVLRESPDPDDRFIVLADPEGNEFCMVM